MNNLSKSTWRRSIHPDINFIKMMQPLIYKIWVITSLPSVRFPKTLFAN